MHQAFESVRQTLLVDDSLTENERNEAIIITSKIYDTYKIINNEGTKRICENCNQECLATTYCELCVRNYLKENFSNWTSGNDAVDNLIKECQLNTLEPIKTIEWIPYNHLEDIKYLTKGGCSEIYTAIWIDKRYDEWDSREQRLKRIEKPGFVQSVILKGLENVENASLNWFEEATAHLILNVQSNDKIETMQKEEDKHYTNVKELQSNYKIETMLKQGEKHYNIDDIQSSYKIETMQKQEEKHHINVDDIQSSYKIEMMQKQEEKHYPNVDDVQSNYKIETMQNQEEKHYTNVEDVQSSYKIETMQKQEEKYYPKFEDVQINYKIETMQKQIKVDDESKLPKCKNGKKHVLRQLWCFKTCFACFERCFKPFSK
ncbi:hypothetical protein GLOIN_2v1845907 [Rhizophagus irregularis DAOM 181602=DAOM 197198]|uniref:Protein kinase domain-containing protein n=1 Tax=Rhizophagus irregularis (strain DAOM 181602 / DAOM 197198 / MUCL 43194) TaxID=747089 RepID=A0A2P4PDG3_RHIID|nr:hypothetical protein GLOIN_2v1845907 [Rhizophagus irregularis DAOM 181602=DAOM 197198]POG63438.1 hypothetical protein GLOIN_2v1845907 [Rhizophagus irregularis DAOM 181602=DAOM 197198]|eukprot:XP_025170304.1 hypothetical protein GLOIN_2v1845907 [Rhizophagus irregularis DAOM 181602=DAOM 197198]